MTATGDLTTSTQRARETVLLLDPAVSSMNLGDQIIADGGREALREFLHGRRQIEISTHLPMSWNYMRRLRAAEWKFVLGSNLLRGRMNGVWRQWDLTPKSAPIARGAILLGVGWWQYGDGPNRYTSALYRYTLNSEYLHSVRDHYTGEMLRKMGMSNVVVTGCPSLWELTPEHCASLPAEAGDAVVTTVTDYNEDPASDRPMLEELARRYGRVIIWPQGVRDLDYLASLQLTTRFEILEPSLAAFDAAISAPGTDYWGTRLHAGIRALKHGTRAMVVAIDNRATEMHRSFGLPIAARGDQSAIADWAANPPTVELALPWEAIADWKGQF